MINNIHTPIQNKTRATPTPTYNQRPPIWQMGQQTHTPRTPSFSQRLNAPALLTPTNQATQRPHHQQTPTRTRPNFPKSIQHELTNQ